LAHLTILPHGHTKTRRTQKRPHTEVQGRSKLTAESATEKLTSQIPKLLPQTLRNRYRLVRRDLARGGNLLRTLHDVIDAHRRTRTHRSRPRNLVVSNNMLTVNREAIPLRGPSDQLRNRLLALRRDAPIRCTA